MLKKLDSYVLSEFWLPLISGLGIITGVWLGIDKFKQVFKLLAKSGAGIDKGLENLGLESPQILALTTPIGILLAAFLTFQKLSGQSETLAMRAAGVSFMRLMRPVITLGLLGALFSFTISEFVVPVTTPLAKKMYTYALYKDPIPSKSAKSFSYFEKNAKGSIKRIFYVKRMKDDILHDIVILDFAQDNVAQIFTALKGAWSAKKGGWILRNGSSHYIKGEDDGGGKKKEESESLGKSLSLVTSFESTFIPSSLNPRKILEQMKDTKEMSIVDLKKFISLHDDGGIHTDELNDAKTRFHTKFSYPFACVFLALAGAALGITGRRKIINWGYIALGLIVFVFYMSQTVFDSLGDSGKVLPLIAAWLPNGILALIAGSAVWYRAEN